MDHHAPRSIVYAFGPLRLDTTRRLLIGGSRISALSEKPFRILMMLVESNGRLVSRQTLIDLLWPDEDVGENSLTQQVYLLRKLIENHGGMRSYIKAESKRGYRFTPPVASVDRSANHFSPHIAGAVAGVIARDEFGTFRRYCEACYQLEKRTHESLLAAAATFAEVVDDDPLHWQSLLGMAKAYAFLGGYLYAPGTQVFPKAKAALLKALEIHPSAEAHAQFAEILMFGEWDWGGARASMETALALEPESASVHNHATWLAIGSGDFDRALYEARAALELEPASLFYRNLLSRVLIHRREYDSAIALLSRVLEIDSTMDPAIENLAFAYIASDRPALTVDLLRNRAENGILSDHMRGFMARAYGDAGRTTEGERIRVTLLDAMQTRYVPAWPIALAAAGLNRCDEAIDQLGRAVREREASMVFLRGVPLFDKLRDLDAFQAVATAVPAP